MSGTFTPEEFSNYSLSEIVATSGGSSAPAGNTTTTSTTTPWSGQQPYLTQAFNAAANLYAGAGPQYYPTSTVAAQSPATQQAMSQLLAYGTDPNSVQTSSMNAATALNDPSFDASTPGNSTYNTIAGQNNAAQGLATTQANGGLVGSNVLSNIANTTQPNANAQDLQGYASGANLTNDPNLQAVMNTANANTTNAYMNTIAPQTQATFDSAGRYGSGANQAAVGEAQRQLGSQLATSNASLLQNNYNQQQQNQLTAAGQITNSQQAATAQQAAAAQQAGTLALNATGQLANTSNLSTQAQLAAASGLGTNYNNNVTNQTRGLFTDPTISQLPATQAAATASVGSAQDAYAQSQLNAQIAAYNYNQTAPYQNLGVFQQEIAGNYGGETQTNSPYFNSGSSTAGSALSGAATGAAMGSAFGPYGTAIGGAGGLLAGLFQ